MAAERSGAGGAGSVATAAARPAFLSQSLADRRAEVQAWSVDQANMFFREMGHTHLCLSGAELWNVDPLQLDPAPTPGRRVPLARIVSAMRAEGDPALTRFERRSLNAAARFVRCATPVHVAAAPTAAANEGAAGDPAESAAAPAAASSSAASVERGADSSSNELAAKRARDTSPASAEHPLRQVLPAAATSSASAALSTALFRELPSSSNDPTPRAALLRIESLLQEWFVDSVPSELICSVCLDVVRDPPNLEACGQSHSRAPQ